jgi:hypothetical protein
MMPIGKYTYWWTRVWVPFRGIDRACVDLLLVFARVINYLAPTLQQVERGNLRRDDMMAVVGSYLEQETYGLITPPEDDCGVWTFRRTESNHVPLSRH